MSNPLMGMLGGNALAPNSMIQMIGMLKMQVILRL